jgi:hypothetical protein
MELITVRRPTMFLASIILLTLLSSQSVAHIAATQPAGGRDGPTDDDQKFSRADPNNPAQVDNPSPCGPSTTANNPRLAYQPGQQVTFNFTETINHPGRFVVQFSPANLQGFWAAANQLGTLNDPNLVVGSPLSITVTLPNTPCETCALRLLQVMTDQPGQYYVHCFDIRIAAGATPSPSTQPTPTPAGGGGGENEKNSGSSNGNNAPRMGGCGTVDGGSSASSGGSLVIVAIAFLLALGLRIRARTQLAKI